jgi:hypothetical protein
MPTVFRIGRLRVVIYPNDHRPAHVHVIGDGCEASFFLGCPVGLAVLRENFGFSQADITRILEAVAAALSNLCERWRLIHG